MLRLKRFAPILLLALLLYNAFGYYLLFLYGIEKARIDARFVSEHDLQVARFKIALYVSVEDTDFEYPDKEFSIEGKSYHIVKQRVKNDSLEIYFLRNRQQERLTADVNNIVRSQQPLQGSPASPVRDYLKSFLKDYLPCEHPLYAPANETCAYEACRMAPVLPDDKRLSAFLPIFSPPPEQA